MPSLTRFSVSLENDLLERFDELVARKGYGSRSEALRDLIRGTLIQEGVRNPSARTAAVLAIVYEHTTRDLGHRLTEIQHEHNKMIVSTMHVHIDRTRCLEVVLLRGQAGRIRDLANAVTAMRGVLHTHLMFACEECS
ncbi:MAG: nickel-responsive transcriptional regulator NikR [Bacteroidota bacterium]|nr:nickel-responsive transcriptional regulator NikR [Bacteroidota bacterium]